MCRVPPAAALRRLRAALLTTSLLVAVALALPVRESAAAPCWRPPVPAPVADPFRPPPCRWCAGNRGIEYATVPGTTVRAVAGGTVTFSGVVAGTRYVVVELPSGWRLTYGRLASSALRTGDRVVGEMTIGRAGGALFFGLRVDGRYRDPAPHLGTLAGRPRLVPADGTAPRPAPPPRLRCATGS